MTRAQYQNGIIPQGHFLAPYTGLAVPNGEGQCEINAMGAGGRITTFRKMRGLTQAQLAQMLQVEQPTVQRWEKGTREPTLDKYREIAAALGVDLSDLLSKDEIVPIGPRLFVKGEVAAGAWREAFEAPEDEWLSFNGRPDVKAEVQHRFGLRVVGDSMDLLYPEGTILECVSTFGNAEALPGKRVVILRKRADQKYEATVKELVLDANGKLWAVPKSSNPTHQAICLNGDQGPDILETRIAAVVVAATRLE